MSKKTFISEENKEKIKDRIIRDIWALFETKEEKEERKKQKRKINERLIKDEIIRYVKTLVQNKKKKIIINQKV